MLNAGYKYNNFKYSLSNIVDHGYHQLCFGVCEKLFYFRVLIGCTLGCAIDFKITMNNNHEE